MTAQFEKRYNSEKRTLEYISLVEKLTNDGNWKSLEKKGDSVLILNTRRLYIPEIGLLEVTRKYFDLTLEMSKKDITASHWHLSPVDDLQATIATVVGDSFKFLDINYDAPHRKKDLALRCQDNEIRYTNAYGNTYSKEHRDDCFVFLPHPAVLEQFKTILPRIAKDENKVQEILEKYYATLTQQREDGVTSNKIYYVAFPNVGMMTHRPAVPFEVIEENDLTLRIKLLEDEPCIEGFEEDMEYRITGTELTIKNRDRRGTKLTECLNAGEVVPYYICEKSNDLDEFVGTIFPYNPNEKR